MKNIIIIVLYGALGMALGAGGILVSQNPWAFFAIMAIVGLIEILARSDTRDSA